MALLSLAMAFLKNSLNKGLQKIYTGYRHFQISHEYFSPQVGVFTNNYDICIPFSKTTKLYLPMARVCDITGKRARTGNNVSHANNKTKRKFYPNLQKKRFYLPEEDKWITLKVATSALRTINKNGITAVLKKARENGNVLV